MPKLRVGSFILDLGDATPVKVLEILRDELIDHATSANDKEEEERLLEKARGIERHMFQRKIPDMTVQEVKKSLIYVKGKIKRNVDPEDLPRLNNLLSLLEYRFNELHYVLYLEEIEQLRIFIKLNDTLRDTEAVGHPELLSLLKEENRVFKGKLTRRLQAVEQVGSLIYAKVMLDTSAFLDASGASEEVRKDVLRRMAEQLGPIYTPEQDIKT